VSIFTQLPEPPRRKGKPKPRKGFLDSVSAGYTSGSNQISGGFQGIRQVGNEVVGDKVAAADAAHRADNLAKESQAAMEGVTSSTDDVRTDTFGHAVNDTASYLGNIAGQLGGALVSTGAGLGAKLATGAVVKYGGKLLPMIAKNSSHAKQAGKVLSKTGNAIIKKGNTATLLAPTVLSNAGNTMHGVRDEGGTTNDALRAGATTAVLSAAANYLPTKFAIGRAKGVLDGTKKATRGGAAKTLTIGAGLGGLSEVGDELAQESGRYAGTGNFDMSTKRLKDAFIAGAITDGALDVTTTAAKSILSSDKQERTLADAIAAIDTDRETALAAIRDSSPEELSSTLSELRVRMLDPSSGSDAGVSLYAAEKVLQEQGSIDARVDDAIEGLDALIITKSEQSSNDLVFDKANPYDSFRNIAASVEPNVSAYLYSHLADGLGAGVKAAARLGITIQDTSATDTSATDTSTTDTSTTDTSATDTSATDTQTGGEAFTIGISPTQVTDASGAVVDKFSAALRNISTKEGVDVTKSSSTVGVYGAAETSTNTEVFGSSEDVARAVSNVAKEYNQDDVIITQPTDTLTDASGKYVARPSLVVSFDAPLSKEAAVAYVEELTKQGVSGATLTKDSSGNYTGLTAVSFPELASRFNKDVKAQVEAGGSEQVLAADQAIFSAVADSINSAEGATASIIPVKGKAIGREGYATPSHAVATSPIQDIEAHVAAQSQPELGALDKKAANEANKFAAAGTPLDPTQFGHTAARFGEFTGKNTEEQLKRYPIPKELIASPLPTDAPTKAQWDNVSANLRTMMDKFGFEHDTFSFDKDTFKAPRLKAQGYDKGKVWIYNPFESSGAFNDPEYTKTWRIVHEMAHAITEQFMHRRYGDSRRQGALGKKTEYPVGNPSKGITKEFDALTTTEAMRAVEWEDVSFRVQRMLFEDAGVFVSDEDFNSEYITNIADATHRVLTGEFADSGKVGFSPTKMDAHTAYLSAMHSILDAAKFRGSEEATVKPRILESRLRDALFARTAEVNGISATTTESLVERINSVIGKNIIVTLDANLESLGEYDTAGRLIRISTKQPLSALRETLDHEMFHALSANVLSPANLSVMRRAYNKGSKHHNNLIERLRSLGMDDAANEAIASPDEAAAYAFQLYRSGDLFVGGTLSNIFNKIVEYIEKVGNYFKGLGFVSSEGIMHMASTGGFADANVLAEPNALYAAVLDAEASVMHSKGHTKMYRDFMTSVEKGELSHVSEADIKDYADMLDKLGSPTMTSAEKWRTVVSGGWKQWSKDNKVSAVTSVVDRLYPLLELDRYKTGESSRTHAQSYMSATEAVHSSKIAYFILEHGQIKIDDAGDIVPVVGTKGLYDILAPVHEIQDTVLAYMIAKRALRIGREEGATMGNPDGLFAEDGKGLFTRAELTATIKMAEEHEKFADIDAAAEAYYELNTSLLGVAKEVGAINEGMFDALVSSGDYIPMYREMEGFIGAPKAAKGTNLSGGINTLHNSNIQIANVLDNMHRNITGITQLIASTRAMKSIDEALVKVDEDTGMPVHKFNGKEMPLSFEDAKAMELLGHKVKPVYSDGIWEEAVPLQNAAATASNVASGLRKQGIDIGKLSKEQRDGIVEFSALIAPKGEDIVTFMRNGKRVHRKVIDADILRAIKGLTSGRSTLPNFVKAASRTLVRTIVAFPAFWVVSTARDVLTAYATTDINLRMSDFIRGFGSAVKKDKYYQEALLSGALPTAGHSQTGDISFDASVAAKKTAAGRFASRGIFGTVLATAERGANIAENIARLAVYRRSMEEGLSRKQAGFLARDLLDFGKHGDNGAMLAAIDSMPFLNARFQGGARLYTGAKEHKARMAKVTGAMFVMSFGLAVNNYRDERYKRLTEPQKDMYWHFFLPEEWGVNHLVFPKPFELGIIATAAERLAQFALYDGTIGLLMERAAFATVSTLAIAPLPQVALPYAEAAANKSIFTGREIVPTYIKGIEPSEQVLPNTSALGKGIAQVTKAVPDLGTITDPIKSPILIDHMIRGYLGSFGSYILEASNAADAALRGVPRPESKLSEYKILGLTRFLGESWSKSSADKDMGYAMLNKVNTIQATIAFLKKNGDIAKAREYEKDNKKYLVGASDIKYIMGRVRNINKSIIEYNKNKRKLPSKLLRAKLDALYKKQGDDAAKLRKYHKVFQEVF